MRAWADGEAVKAQARPSRMQKGVKPDKTSEDDSLALSLE